MNVIRDVSKDCIGISKVDMRVEGEEWWRERKDAR